MAGIFDDIKSGVFKRVYLLHGPESYLRLEHMHRLADAIVPPEDSMNRATYDGEQLSEQDIIDFAESLPFLGTHRLVVVKDSAFFEKSTETLPDYIPHIPEHSTILFCETKADGRNRLYKAVEKYGMVVPYARPDQKKDKAAYADAIRLRKQWAGKMLLDAGLRITERDMDHLLARIGHDMSTIRLETDKLIHACAGQEVVTAEDIDRYTTAQLQDRIFEMMEAIARGNQSLTLTLYRDLLALNTGATSILFHLGREYRRLYAIRSMRSRGVSQDRIASALHLHPYVVKKLIPIAMKDDETTLEAKLRSIAAAEEDIKSGRVSDRLACEMEILSLMPRSY